MLVVKNNRSVVSHSPEYYCFISTLCYPPVSSFNVATQHRPFSSVIISPSVPPPLSQTSMDSLNRPPQYPTLWFSILDLALQHAISGSIDTLTTAFDTFRASVDTSGGDLPYISTCAAQLRSLIQTIRNAKLCENEQPTRKFGKSVVCPFVPNCSS